MGTKGTAALGPFISRLPRPCSLASGLSCMRLEHILQVIAGNPGGMVWNKGGKNRIERGFSAIVSQSPILTPVTDATVAGGAQN